jgi:hypothetical protein
MLQQHDEHLNRLLPQLDADAVLAQFPGANIELERTEAEKPRLWLQILPGPG